MSAPREKRKKSEPPPPPAVAPLPPLQPPPPTPPPAEQPEAEPEAPVIQNALDAVAAAKARAAEAEALAAAPVTLPATPAHNTIGEQLRDTLHPYAPERELLVPVRIDIDGALLAPPAAQSYRDELLWNAHEASVTPEGFARLTCAEVGLPVDAFEQPIATQIRRAVAEALASAKPVVAVPAAAAAAAAAAAEAAAAAAAAAPQETIASQPTNSVIPLEMHISHASGIELHDRVLWDTGDSTLTPEAFAQQLCADVGLPELEGAVAFAVREQLLQARSSREAEAETPLVATGDAVVRSESESESWTTRILIRDLETPAPAAAEDAAMSDAPPAAQDGSDMPLPMAEG
jgi:hypothetical protein